MCSTIWAYQFCYHGFQTSPIKLYERHFWPPSEFHFHVCKWCLICIIQQAYKFVSSSLWPHLMFAELKISLSYWIQVGGDWKRMSCHGNRIIITVGTTYCGTISLPIFNGPCLYDIINHLICSTFYCGTVQ